MATEQNAPEPLTDAEREVRIAGWRREAVRLAGLDEGNAYHAKLLDHALALMRAPSAENAQLRAELEANAASRRQEREIALLAIKKALQTIERAEAENATLRAGGDARLREATRTLLHALAVIEWEWERSEEPSRLFKAEVSEAAEKVRELLAAAPAPKAEAGGQTESVHDYREDINEIHCILTAAKVPPNYGEAPIAQVSSLRVRVEKLVKDRDAALAKLAEVERERDRYRTECSRLAAEWDELMVVLDVQHDAGGASEGLIDAAKRMRDKLCNAEAENAASLDVLREVRDVLGIPRTGVDVIEKVRALKQQPAAPKALLRDVFGKHYDKACEPAAPKADPDLRALLGFAEKAARTPWEAYVTQALRAALAERVEAQAGEAVR